jgi:hypothetical protein
MIVQDIWFFAISQSPNLPFQDKSLVAIVEFCFMEALSPYCNYLNHLQELIHLHLV